MTEKDPDSSVRLGNTKSQVAPAKNWSLTLFDYTQEDIALITSSKNLEKYAFQEEECPTTKKRHLQGFIVFKEKVRFRKSDDQIIQLEFRGKKPHWEKVRNLRAIYDYVTKQETLVGERWVSKSLILEKKPLKLISEDMLYEWQKDIIKIIESEPDDRTIYWIWENKGNIGKTSFIKYLLTYYDTSTFSRATKSADILTCASLDKNIYLFDFARSQTEFCPYLALEQLKDGLISDSKLKKETRNIIMNPPHVICFANWPPKTKMLSGDRWKIINLREDEVSDNDESSQ